MADVTLMMLPAKSFEGDGSGLLTDWEEPAVFGGAQERGWWAFDDTTEQAIVSGQLVMPTQYAAGTLKAKLYYVMASTTSGTVEFEVAVEAVTDGDATDLDSASSFDTVNSGSVTVPGTAGHLDVITLTLTNKDSIAAGDSFRLAIQRDSNDGTNDTATGDARLLAVEIVEDQ